MQTSEELTKLERDVLEAIRQTQSGQFATVHTPEQILRRKPGRPAGSVAQKTKRPVTLRLDADVLEAFRATGKGWQTRINDALRQAAAQTKPVAGASR